MGLLTRKGDFIEACDENYYCFNCRCNHRTTAQHFAPNVFKVLDPYLFTPLGQIFLNLIKMLVVPIVFFSITLGVAGLGDPKNLAESARKPLLTFYSLRLLPSLLASHWPYSLSRVRSAILIQKRLIIPQKKPHQWQTHYSTLFQPIQSNR